MLYQHLSHFLPNGYQAKAQSGGQPAVENEDQVIQVLLRDMASDLVGVNVFYMGSFH